MSIETQNAKATSPRRPSIAFFDYPDVFEDFYSHYGIDQETFATEWRDSGNHAFIAALQKDIGDVTWYAFSLKPELKEAVHRRVGCTVKFFRSSLGHRLLWRAFYSPKAAWRWRRLYPAYATIASYVALMSFSFLRALRRDRPDILFVQDYATGRFDVLTLLARLLKVPLIAYHSGSRPERYVGRWAKRWTIPAAQRLLASSTGEAEMLAERFAVPPERLAVVLTPLDTETYRPTDRSEACKELNLDPSRRYLLFVGRLDDTVKRISTILRSFSKALSRHPDVDLLIAGSGRDEEALRSLAAKTAPNRVRFLGWVSAPREKTLLYNAAECLLLPSLREGFPTVVGEAMACGTPVIGSRLNGIVELVEEEKTGWLISPGDEGELTRAIETVVEDPARARSMRTEARRRAVERLSPASVVAELKRVFLAPPADTEHEDPKPPGSQQRDSKSPDSKSPESKSRETASPKEDLEVSEVE